MTDNEMKNKAREYKELKALAEQIAAELTELEEDFKAELKARGTDLIAVDVYKIRWTEVDGSRFDTTAFRSAMPDLAKLYTKTTAYRRFSIA